MKSKATQPLPTAVDNIEVPELSGVIAANITRAINTLRDDPFRGRLILIEAVREAISAHGDMGYIAVTSFVCSSGGKLAFTPGIHSELEYAFHFDAVEAATAWLESEPGDCPRNYQRGVRLFWGLPDLGRAEFVASAWEAFGYGEIGPGVLGAIATNAHGRGKIGSLLSAQYDFSEITEIFQAANERTLHWGDRNGWRRYSRKVRRAVFRGGHASPEDLAGGISWTEDLEQARWFANRFQKKGTVVRTVAGPDDILACFDYEREVVIRHTPLRSVEVVP